MGFRIPFCFKILTLEIVKNCFSQNESETTFLEEKCVGVVAKNWLVLRFFGDPLSVLGN